MVFSTCYCMYFDRDFCSNLVDIQSRALDNIGRVYSILGDFGKAIE